jgi:hypothetical protein
LVDAEQLFSNAQKYALSRGFRLGDGVDYQFHRIAMAAAAQMNRDPHDLQQQRLRIAAANFETMIKQMIRERERLPGYAPGILGEQVFAAASKKFSSLWPFDGQTRMELSPARSSAPGPGSPRDRLTT